MPFASRRILSADVGTYANEEQVLHDTQRRKSSQAETVFSQTETVFSGVTCRSRFSSAELSRANERDNASPADKEREFQSKKLVHLRAEHVYTRLTPAIDFSNEHSLIRRLESRYLAHSRRTAAGVANASRGRGSSLAENKILPLFCQPAVVSQVNPQACSKNPQIHQGMAPRVFHFPSGTGPYLIVQQCWGSAGSGFSPDEGGEGGAQVRAVIGSVGLRLFSPGFVKGPRNYSVGRIRALKPVQRRA